MRLGILFFILSSAITARADFAAGLTGAASPSKNGSGSKNQNSYTTKKQDAAYNNTIKKIDEGYGQQTKAINSEKYDSYLKSIDSTYDKMVNNINNGKPAGASELPKYQPEQVGGGLGGITTAATAGSTATGSGEAATAASGGESAAAESSQSLAQTNPVVASILSVCPQSCGGAGGHACMSDCARGVAMNIENPDRDEDNSGRMLALMMLMGGSSGSGDSQ